MTHVTCETWVDSDVFCPMFEKTEYLHNKQTMVIRLYALLYSFVIYKLRKKIVY